MSIFKHKNLFKFISNSFHNKNNSIGSTANYSISFFINRNIPDSLLTNFKILKTIIILSFFFTLFPYSNSAIKTTANNLVIIVNKLTSFNILIMGINYCSTIKLIGLIVVPNPNCFISSTWSNSVKILRPSHILNFALVTF